MYKHDDTVRDKVMRVVDSVTHQGIGGQTITLEFGLSCDEVFDQSMLGNWACMNFINRRDDFNCNFPHQLYYGKVNGLGYVVAEDELEEI